MGLGANVRNAKAFREAPLEFFRGLSFEGGRYRPVVRFPMFGANVVVNDPDSVGAIMAGAAPDERFTKEEFRFFMLLRRFLNLGLFTNEGEAHRAQRKVVAPLLQPASLIPFTGGFVGRAVSAVEAWDGAIDPHTEAGALALNVLIDTIAGPDCEDAVRLFAAGVHAAEGGVIDLISSPVIFPESMPTPKNRRLASAVDEVQRWAAEVVARRRQEPTVNGTCPISGALVEATHSAGAASESVVADEMLTMLVAGYQTTAAALSFSWYLLAQHPEWIEELRAEYDEVLGDRDPTSDDVPQLKRTLMVIKESMRLYPPVWVIARRAVHATELAGVSIPRNASVWIIPYTLHRHPDHWEKPEDFHPEHFGPRVERHRHAYQPFASGVHKCVGNHYALRLAVLTMPVVLRRVDFAPPDGDFTAKTRAFTYPVGPPLRITRRALAMR
jgi:cytochrome P450